MNQAVSSDRMIFLSGKPVSAALVNAIHRALIRMQGGDARRTQIEIVQAVLQNIPLTKEQKVELTNAVSLEGEILHGDWLPIVTSVILTRMANRERCQLHAMPF